MKKFLTFFLSLCMVIGSLSTFIACSKDDDDEPPHTHSYVEGFCSCGATDPNYTPHSHVYVGGSCSCGATDPNYTPQPSDTTEVTDAEWIASFNFGTNYVLTIDSEYAVDDTELCVLKRVGDTFEFREAEYEGTEAIYDEIWYYDLAQTSQKEYEPKYNDMDQLVYYVANEFGATPAIMEEYMLGEYMPEGARAKSHYTYDATKGKYTASTVTFTVNSHDAVINNVEVSFKNKKLVGVYYEIVDGTDVEKYTMTISYGNASFSIPTNVYNENDVIGGTVTVGDVANALKIGTNYTILFTENDLTDGDEIINEYSRDDNILYHKYVKYNASNVLVGSYDEYKQIVGEEVFAYHYNEGSDNYEKGYSNESAEKIDVDLFSDCSFIEDLQNPYLYTFVAEGGVNYLTLDRYENETRQYMGQFIAEISYVYTNIKIELDANENIVKITYNLVGHVVVKNEQGSIIQENNGNSNMMLELTFGSTELELPANIFDPNNQGDK